MSGNGVPSPVPLACRSFGGRKRCLFGSRNLQPPDSIHAFSKIRSMTSRRFSGLRKGAEFIGPTMKRERGRGEPAGIDIHVHIVIYKVCNPTGVHGMTKYQPITEFLQGQPVSEWRVSFRKIEEILGFPLPQSARRHPAWWANNPGGHPHCLAWLDAGWKTEQVDLEGEQVTFRKTGAEGTPDRGQRPSIFGCLKGTVTVAPGVDLTEPTGVVWSAQRGKLHE